MNKIAELVKILQAASEAAKKDPKIAGDPYLASFDRRIAKLINLDKKDPDDKYQMEILNSFFRFNIEEDFLILKNMKKAVVSKMKWKSLQIIYLAKNSQHI